MLHHPVQKFIGNMIEPDDEKLYMHISNTFHNNCTLMQNIFFSRKEYNSFSIHKETSISV